MQKLLVFIKKHKIILIVSLAVVVVLAIVIVTAIKNKPKEPAPVNITQSNFKLQSVSPSEGIHSTIDSAEYLYFTFSLPVDSSTVSIKVTPYVKLKAVVYTQRNVLVVVPDYDIWKPNIEYKLVLSNVTSINDRKLNSDVLYTFTNNPPKDIKTGEGIVPPTKVQSLP